MGSDAIALNFLKKLDPTDCLFHVGFGEIRFSKRRNQFQFLVFGNIKSFQVGLYSS